MCCNCNRMPKGVRTRAQPVYRILEIISPDTTNCYILVVAPTDSAPYSHSLRQGKAKYWAWQWTDCMWKLWGKGYILTHSVQFKLPTRPASTSNVTQVDEIDWRRKGKKDGVNLKRDHTTGVVDHEDLSLTTAQIVTNVPRFPGAE